MVNGSCSGGSRAAQRRRNRFEVPDGVLLRRFGHVRAVGGAAYFAAVAVLAVLFGRQVWPLAIGVPVLAVVTTAYFQRSSRYPRASVAVSLLADAVVLGGAVMFLGGTGSGLVLLYTIVVVSAAILLGPLAGAAFTALCVALGALQFALEQAGVEPALLHRPDAGDRLPILLASLAGVTAVGYVSSTYASRLQQLVAVAAEEAAAVQARERRRHRFVRSATADVRAPLGELEALAAAIEQRGGAEQSWDADVARRIRSHVTRLEGEVGMLADVGLMDAVRDSRPVPVALDRVVDECMLALADRLAAHPVAVDVDSFKVLGHPDAVRRVVFNLLENVADHTPGGTAARVTGVVRGAQGVLIVADDGPGLPPGARRRTFEPDAGGQPVVGLPLVRELCEAMSSVVRLESSPDEGTRVAVLFRLAPPSAPAGDDDRVTEDVDRS